MMTKYYTSGTIEGRNQIVEFQSVQCQLLHYRTTELYFVVTCYYHKHSLNASSAYREKRKLLAACVPADHAISDVTSTTLKQHNDPLPIHRHYYSQLP